MERYIKLLDFEMAVWAHDALTKPADKTEFEYGRVSGLYQGLSKAKEILLQLQAGDEEKERAS